MTGNYEDFILIKTVIFQNIFEQRMGTKKIYEDELTKRFFALQKKILVLNITRKKIS